MDPATNAPQHLPIATPHISVSTDPTSVRHQPPSQTLDHTGVSTYFAIRRELKAQHDISMGDDIKFSKVTGHFSKDNGAVVADTYTQDGKSYFKFDVRWEAKVGEAPNDKSVSFNQTIYTSIKVPSGTDAQNYENAKQNAYQVAKSYELIQKNLVKPENPPQNYGTQIDIIKSQNKILFEKIQTSQVSSLGGRVLQFNAMAESGLPVYFTSVKTNDQGENISRFTLMAEQRVVLKGNENVSRERFLPMNQNADTPLANFERMERGIDPIPEDQRAGFTAYIDTKIRDCDRKFQESKVHLQNGIEHATDSLGMVNEANGDFRQQKERYLVLSAPMTVAEQLAVPVGSLRERNELREKMETYLGIPALEANLQGLKDQKNILLNAFERKFVAGGRENPAQMAETLCLINIHDIADMEAKILKLREDIVAPFPDSQSTGRAAPINRPTALNTPTGAEEITVEHGADGGEVLEQQVEIELEEVKVEVSIGDRIKQNVLSAFRALKPKSKEEIVVETNTPQQTPLSEMEINLLRAANAGPTPAASLPPSDLPPSLPPSDLPPELASSDLSATLPPPPPTSSSTETSAAGTGPPDNSSSTEPLVRTTLPPSPKPINSPENI